MNFKQFLYEEKKLKKVVVVEYDSKTKNALKKYCIENGFDLTKNYNKEDISPDDFNFHVTIFFTASEHSIKNGSYDVEPFEINPKSFEMLGPDKNIPVMRVQSDEILKIRKKYEKLGMEDTWPEYKPHTTLAYNWNGKPQINNIKLPTFPLMANKIVVRNQS